MSEGEVWADDAWRAMGPGLAMDVMAGLREPEEILARWGLTEGQFVRLAETPWFKHMCVEAKVRWNSDLKAQDRIKAKALMALEEALHVPHNIAVDTTMSGSTRLEAIKALERLSGVMAEREQNGVGAGSGFSITINLPGKTAITAEVRNEPTPVLDGEGEEVEAG